MNKKKFKNIHDLSYYLEGKNDPKDKFVAFISGLNLKYDKSQESLKKFKEFMFGNMPDIRFRKVRKRRKRKLSKHLIKYILIKG